MSWGLALADAHYLPAYVEATAGGLPLYLKHGFQRVDTMEIDLRPWGSSHIIEHTILVRPAKAPDASIDQVMLSPYLTNQDLAIFAPVENKAFTPEGAPQVAEEQESPSFMHLITKDVKVDKLASRANILIRIAVTDNTAHLVKAFIPRTNQVVGWAKWNFCLSLSARPLHDPWSEGAKMVLVDAFFGAMHRAQEEHMKGKLYLFMHVLVVLPEWQRKSIGKRMLEWGLNVADQKGLESWIDVSPEGLGLYKKMGWKEVWEAEVDLGEWGGKKGENAKVVSLIRKAIDGKEAS